MKLFVIVALCVATAAARGTGSWNSLLKADVFTQDLDSPRSRSGHPSVLLNELSGLLNDPEVLNQVFSTYRSLFGSVEGKSLDFESGLTGSPPQVFKANVLEIAEHNLAANAGKHTWTKGINQFSHLTAEEFHKIYTPSLVNLTAAFEASGLRRVPLSLSSDEPADSKNWRDEKMVTPVKNQGNCGSCYAFATVGALESVYAINNNGKLLDLSEQEMVDCSKNSGCNGGFWYDSFDYLKNGVASESSYRYTARKSSCNSRKARSKVAYAQDYALTTQGDEDEMVKTLAEKGPLAVAVSTKNWQHYSSGIFDDDCGTGVDHAVLLVGYSEDDGLLIKNSWATSWGEEGYIRLPRRGNKCQVAEYPCWVSSK